MKKVLVLLTVIIISVLSIKVYLLNKKAIYPISQQYKKGETVAIENNFFNSSKENMNGYSVTVIGTDIVSVNSFCEKYNVKEKEELLRYDYIYMVKVDFQNNDNSLGENAGINIGEYMITNGAFMNYYCSEAYPYLNDFDSPMFSLRPNSNKEFIIPFAIDEEFISLDKIKNGNSKLIVSLYPYQKELFLA